MCHVTERFKSCGTDLGICRLAWLLRGEGLGIGWMLGLKSWRDVMFVVFLLLLLYIDIEVDHRVKSENRSWQVVYIAVHETLTHMFGWINQVHWGTNASCRSRFEVHAEFSIYLCISILHWWDDFQENISTPSPQIKKHHCKIWGETSIRKGVTAEVATFLFRSKPSTSVWHHDWVMSLRGKAVSLIWLYRWNHPPPTMQTRGSSYINFNGFQISPI